MKNFTQVVFICAMVYILYIFSTNISFNSDIKTIRADLQTFENEVNLKLMDNVRHLESRMNRVAQSQDEYQSSTDARLRVLEGKLSGHKTSSDRNININNNHITNIP